MATATKTAADHLLDAQDIIRKKNATISALKSDLVRARRDADTAEEIRRTIFNLSEHDPAPPAWIRAPCKENGKRGAPITMWTDWHYSEVVRPEQVGGVNAYNAKIAKNRVTKLVNNTIDLCFNHMGRANTTYPGIIICLGGDMISGNIHDELTETNDRTSWQAVNDLTDLLAGSIDQIATKFGHVWLPCVVGNHGRGTLKPRAKNRVYTSFDWSIYTNLERYFKPNKHVKFSIPSEADAHFTVYGHRFMLTHGDALGVKGGDGIIAALGPIARGAFKIGRSEAMIGRDFDTLLMGHWHQQLWLPNAIVANSLKGFDEYAHITLRAPYSRPSQPLFFIHPEQGLTARWEVFLEPRRETQQNKQWLTWQSPQ